MTPSQQAKTAGLKSLADVSRQTGIAVSTLKDWHREKPKMFAIALNGCDKDYQPGKPSYSFTVTCQIEHGSDDIEIHKINVVTDDWRKVVEVSGINPDLITGIKRNPFKVMRPNS